MSKQTHVEVAVIATGRKQMVPVHYLDSELLMKPFRRLASQERNSDGPDHDALKLKQLQDEIDRRNEGREGDAVLSRTGTKAELVAALEADDARIAAKPAPPA